MDFDKFFKNISYGVVLCGLLALVVTGGAGIVITGIFLLTAIAAWFLEGSRWQISERWGTILIFPIVPLFYIDWKYRIFDFGTNPSDIAGFLARIIIVLAAVKILQRKSERDWIFLYLMSFFQVLLAAGLSISPLYLAVLILYLLVTICAIITLEIKRSSRIADKKPINAAQKSALKKRSLKNVSLFRLPVTATTLLLLIGVLALPMFFALPRVGGAGMGSNSSPLSGFTGFSDSVTLGEIGQLEQNDRIVMRARLETSGNNSGTLKWRGVALDDFDKKRWKKTRVNYTEPFVKGERDFFLLDYATDKESLTVQTVYLEPLDTPVLFALSRPVAIQGNFQVLKKDSEGAINFLRGNGYERLSYKIYSDRSLPALEKLKADKGNYSPDAQRYLQIPENMDARIAGLASQLTGRSNNLYDKSKAVENYLQTQFGYTLEMKAKGDEPLADFLFNVREGHCEYFATAMAMMMRTQGIATRVVNGFQEGEYNETADVFVIRQRDAHSWVEVYFPAEDAWIPFDPTPYAGQTSQTNSTGIVGSFNKYLEALETFWIQYFVSYDNQEQQSLMRSMKNGFAEYQGKTSAWLNEFQDKAADWWAEVRGDKGFEASARAVVFGVGYLLAAILGIILIIWLYRKIKKLAVWQRIYAWLKFRNEATIVEFYERMQKVLAGKGFTRAAHQTPLEFASALNMPEAVRITEKYNRVRFGEKNLSGDETQEIESWLHRLENNSAEK